MKHSCNWHKGLNLKYNKFKKKLVFKSKNKKGPSKGSVKKREKMKWLL